MFAEAFTDLPPLVNEVVLITTLVITNSSPVGTVNKSVVPVVLASIPSTEAIKFSTSDVPGGPV
jgi:hypothetical protein